nr:immunoglobulin heavy chain junction region [Mus musculus]
HISVQVITTVPTTL